MTKKDKERDSKFLKITAAVFAILTILILVNGNSSTQTYYPTQNIQPSQTSSQNSVMENGIQVIRMDVLSYGYSPSSFILKKDVPVRWEVIANDLNGCNRAIISPDFNVNVQLNQGNNIIEFTPNKEGTIAFSCSMNMLRGKFIVTQTGTATQDQLNQPPTNPIKTSCGGSGGGCGCGGSR